MKKVINDTNPTIVSHSITFDFSAIQNSPFFGPVKPSGFECSMDGAPFEDCISSKSYYYLQADASHNLQVRAKGILGNVDTSPDKFNFNVITSATVQGVIKENSNGGFITFSLNSDSSLKKKNYTTDSLGIFRLDSIRQGLHLIDVLTSGGNRNDLFFVPSGETIITKSFEIRNMSTHIKSPLKESQLADKSVIPFDNVSSSDKANNTNPLTANSIVNITLTEVLEEIGQKNMSPTLSLYQESRFVQPEYTYILYRHFPYD